MGGITPARTKQKVIRYWLSGLTRDEISSKAGISEGNTSSIIQEIKDSIPDIDLLRELAFGLKKKGYGLDLFASAYRQRAMLQDRGLSDDQIDELIQHVDEHCFQEGTDMPTFIDWISKVSLYSERIGVPISELPELKRKKENEFLRLADDCVNKSEELQEIESRIIAELARERVTNQDILEFKQKEPLLIKNRHLEDRLEYTRARLIDLKVIVSIRDVSGAALNIPTVPHGMTSKDVVKACFLLAGNAPHFRKTINSIIKQEPSLYYKVGDVPSMLGYDKMDIPSY